MPGISVLGISSHTTRALHVRTLARTSLAKKLMKHGNSLETGESVHQISGHLGPVVGAIVSVLSVRSCVVVVCRLCITAQMVLRLTAGLALLEAMVSHLVSNLEDLGKIFIA